MLGFMGLSGGMQVPRPGWRSWPTPAPAQGLEGVKRVFRFLFNLFRSKEHMAEKDGQ
jgi:hypothetical protein